MTPGFGGSALCLDARDLCGLVAGERATDARWSPPWWHANGRARSAAPRSGEEKKTAQNRAGSDCW